MDEEEKVEEENVDNEIEEEEEVDGENVEEEVEELDEWQLAVKYVKRSKYRVRTLKAIGDDVKIPKEIAEDSDILQNHISNVLRQLRNKDLVECLNPNMRKGRLYRLTEDGKDMLDEID